MPSDCRTHTKRQPYCQFGPRSKRSTAHAHSVGIHCSQPSPTVITTSLHPRASIIQEMMPKVKLRAYPDDHFVLTLVGSEALQNPVLSRGRFGGNPSCLFKSGVTREVRD